MSQPNFSVYSGVVLVIHRLIVASGTETSKSELFLLRENSSIFMRKQNKDN